jgi:protein-S-isoprenylcysteine O-methyltransferase Ste14
MELIPALEIGWLNGWVLLALPYLVYGGLLLVFPKQVIARLYEYDRSRWSGRQRASYAVGRLLVLVYFALMIFTPLKTERVVFVPGIILFALGLAGFSIALVDFKNTPLDQPATSGLYRISRHPQVFMGFVLGCGICIAAGSWLALLVLILSSLFGRARTLAEEEACLERYGDSYRAYMKRVPRYFLFV